MGSGALSFSMITHGALNLYSTGEVLLSLVLSMLI